MYKIKRAHIYLVIFASLIFHMTVLSYIKLWGARPDIMLIAVIFFGLFLGERAGFEAGLFAGALKDIFAYDVFGINTFVLGLTGLVVGSMNTKFFKDSKVTQFSVVLLFSLFSMVLHFTAESLMLKTLHLTLFSYVMASAASSSAYTALISLPIFAKLMDMYHLREEHQFL